VLGTPSPKSGDTYAVRFRKPDNSDGEKRGFKTKREATLYLASLDVSKARGEFVDANTARVKISTLGPDWLARQKGHMKPSAWIVLEGAWRVHVEPRWGTTPLSGVKYTDVQAWVVGIDRSASVVIRAYGVLMGILDDAVRDRRLHANPARGIALPRKAKKKRVYLSHQQVDLLARGAGEMSTLVQFLAYTGLRWGEATGLRVGSLDTLRRRVNVTENAVDVNGTIFVGTPKSHNSRSVPYPAFLSGLLAKECEGKSRDDLLFGSGESHVRRSDNRTGWWMKAVAAAEAADPTFDRVTVHDLRHTAASLAISAGANVKAVQRMLGHASAAMTLDTYADLFDDDLDAVGNALDQARTVSIVGKPWASNTTA